MTGPDDTEPAASPQPPMNVRLETPDGRIIPCTVFYTGRAADGDAKWAVRPDEPVPTVEGLKFWIGELPGRTQLDFQIPVADGG